MNFFGWLIVAVVACLQWGSVLSFHVKSAICKTTRLQLEMQSDLITDPLLLRAARGESVERAPVWMMRQAGRHMKVYRDLCVKHKTFRERSETVDLATEIRFVH